MTNKFEVGDWVWIQDSVGEKYLGQILQISNSYVPGEIFIGHDEAIISVPGQFLTRRTLKRLTKAVDEEAMLCILENR